MLISAPTIEETALKPTSTAAAALVRPAPSTRVANSMEIARATPATVYRSSAMLISARTIDKTAMKPTSTAVAALVEPAPLRGSVSSTPIARATPATLYPSLASLVSARTIDKTAMKPLSTAAAVLVRVAPQDRRATLTQIANLASSAAVGCVSSKARNGGRRNGEPAIAPATSF